MIKIEDLCEFTARLLNRNKSLNDMFISNELKYLSEIKLNHEFKSLDGELFKWNECIIMNNYNIIPYNGSLTQDQHKVFVLDYNGKPFVISKRGFEKVIKFLKKQDLKSGFKNYQLEYHEYLKRLKQCQISLPVIKHKIFGALKRKAEESITIEVRTHDAKIEIKYNNGSKGSVRMTLDITKDLDSEINEVVNFIEITREKVESFYSRYD